MIKFRQLSWTALAVYLLLIGMTVVVELLTTHRDNGFPGSPGGWAITLLTAPWSILVMVYHPPCSIDTALLIGLVMNAILLLVLPSVVRALLARGRAHSEE